MKDSNIRLEDLPEMLSIDDIAEYMRVTRPVVINMIEDYKIPVIKAGKKLIRINKEDFKTFLSKVSNSQN